MKRTIRRRLEVVLTLVGIVIIFASVLFGASLGTAVQFMLVVLGVMVLEIGVWWLSNHVLPGDRRFSGLRAEGDNMVLLIRELHTAAVARDRGEEDARRFQDTLAAMHESVARMSELAAKSDSHTTTSDIPATTSEKS